MRTATLIPAAGNPVVLFDGNKFPLADANPDGFKPQVTGLMQLTPLYRAQFQAIYPRYNEVTRWDINIWHFFSTYLACQDFIGNRSAVLPWQAKLMLLTRTGQGAFTRYVRSVLVERPKVNIELGLACQFKYGLIWAGPYSVTP